MTVVEIKKLFKYGIFRYPDGYLVWNEWLKRAFTGFAIYYFNEYHVFPDFLGQFLTVILVFTAILYMLFVFNLKQERD